MVSSDLLQMLACPACHGELSPAEGDVKLLCRACGLAFPVQNGIPVLLVDQAEQTP
jgi:uncharacterized protein YbaR (Trm112 family)